MKFRARQTLRLGPVYINFTQRMNPLVALVLFVFTGGRHRAFSSWGLKVGPYSHNVTRGTSTFNTPGPGSIHFDGKRRRARR